MKYQTQQLNTCSKLTIEALVQGVWKVGNLSAVFIVNFKLILHLALVYILWSLSMYLFALCELFYISIVFRFDGFRFHPFLERISTKCNVQEADLKQWNGKCVSIKFLWWNLNYESAALITNELHFFL